MMFNEFVADLSCLFSGSTERVSDRPDIFFNIETQLVGGLVAINFIFTLILGFDYHPN